MVDYFRAYDEINNRNVRNLFSAVQKVFNYDIGKNTYFSLEGLANILKQKDIKFSYADLHSVINIFINNFEKIIRIDRWNQDPLYKILDERYEQHSYQRTFYDFEDNVSYKNKKFIVISDTHIGNDNIQNFELLNNIYNFSIKNNIKYIFHLGDIFQRVEGISYDERYSNAMKNINLFLEKYPNIDGNLETIALLGNHDLSIHGTSGTDIYCNNQNELEQLYSLRDLCKDNFAFLVYSRTMFEIELSGIPIHFSHRLYIDSVYKNMKITSVNDISNMYNEKYFCNYPICISGHLHSGFLLNAEDSFDNEHLYIGVPSTSNLNVGNVVAYIIDLEVESGIKYVHVSTIYASKDSSVSIGETYTHCLDKKGNALKKEFKKI